MYTIDYFINKFERTTDYSWSYGAGSAVIKAPNCALGKCGGLGSEEAIELGKIVFEYSKERCLLSHGLMSAVWNINDDYNQIYFRGKTPKERILNALYDIKKMQEPKHPEVIYKVVEVDSKVKELIKQERILN